MLLPQCHPGSLKKVIEALLLMLLLLALSYHIIGQGALTVRKGGGRRGESCNSGLALYVAALGCSLSIKLTW